MTDPTDCKAMHREHRMEKLAGASEGAPPESTGPEKVVAAVPTGSPLCLSCGRKPAALRNNDGAYCVDCMKVHSLEKMFVQLTRLNHSHEN